MKVMMITCKYNIFLNYNSTYLIEGGQEKGQKLINGEILSIVIAGRGKTANTPSGETSDLLEKNFRKPD